MEMLSQNKIIYPIIVAVFLLMLFLSYNHEAIYDLFRYSKSLEQTERTELISISPEVSDIANKHKRGILIDAISYVNKGLDSDTTSILAEAIVSMKKNSTVCIIKN
jgi:hypothetical protein